MLVVGHEFADDDEVVGHELWVAVNEGFGFVSFVISIGLASILRLTTVTASILGVPLTRPIPKCTLSIKMRMGQFKYLSLNNQ